MSKVKADLGAGKGKEDVSGNKCGQERKTKGMVSGNFQ